jgi:hypothetical protein
MVFLKPLMEDMKILWGTSVQMLDEYRKGSFTLRAIIFITIYDYSALFTLSCQFKGNVGCAVCIDGTAYVYIYLFVCVNIYIIQIKHVPPL